MIAGCVRSPAAALAPGLPPRATGAGAAGRRRRARAHEREAEMMERERGELADQALQIGAYDERADAYHAVAEDGTAYLVDREAFELAAEEAGVGEDDGEPWRAFLASWHTGMEGVRRA
jgi:hypothetical protein